MQVGLEFFPGLVQSVSGNLNVWTEKLGQKRIIFAEMFQTMGKRNN